MLFLLVLLFYLQGSADEKIGGPSNRRHWSYAIPGKQLLILYGTEYGFSKELAMKLFDRLVLFF